MRKKGEMTTQQIIIMIVLIASFVVILFFLLKLNLGKESQDQLCQNSVMTKASAFSSGSTPLNCYRSYVCITEDGSCEGLTKPEKIKVKSLDEVYETLANEMADCWWMFGAGKVNYVGDDFTKNNYCSICSQILFDDSLNNIKGIENEKISKDELYDYLAENEYSKDMTYAEYVLGTNDISGLKASILGHENNTESISTFGTINIGEQYFVVMGITSDVGWLEWTGVGAGAGAVAIGTVWVLSGPPGWIIGSLILGGGAIIGGTAGTETAGLIEPEIGAVMIEGDGIDNQFMAPTILEVDSDKFNALNCEEILTYT